MLKEAGLMEKDFYARGIITFIGGMDFPVSTPNPSLCTKAQGKMEAIQ